MVSPKPVLRRQGKKKSRAFPAGNTLPEPIIGCSESAILRVPASGLPFVVLRQLLPAALKDKGRILGLTLAGEDALLVAIDPHDALGGLEVGKIPDQFSLDKVVAVKDAKIPLQILVLVFLAPHDAGQLVLGGQGVGAELGKDKGNIQLLGGPLVHLGPELLLGLLDLRAAADVPAIVPVEADHVAQVVAAALVRGAVLLESAGEGPVLGVQGPGMGKDLAEIGPGILAGGLGLIEEAPGDDTGVIFVPGHHLGHLLLVVVQQFRDGGRLEEIGVLAGAGCRKVVGGAHHAHGGHLVDDEESLLVRHLVPLLGVGIVAGAEAVGPGPLHALEIPLGHRPAEAAADDVEILVFAEALQIDGFAIDEDMVSLDFDRADPNFLLVAVIALPCLDDKAVEIGVADLPQMDICHPQGTGPAFAPGHGMALGIHQRHPDGPVAAALHLVVNQGVGPLQLIGETVVGDGLGRGAHQPDAPLDAGIVVEVKIGFADLPAVGQYLLGTAGQGALAQLVVGTNRQPVHLAAMGGGGDIGQDGQEPALMPGHLYAVAVDHGPMGHAAEPDIDLLGILLGQEEVGLIPEVADVVPLLMGGEEIRKAGGYRH